MSPKKRKKTKNNTTGCLIWVIPLALGVIILYANAGIRKHIGTFFDALTSKKNSQVQKNKILTNPNNKNSYLIKGIINNDLDRIQENKLEKLNKEIKKNQKPSKIKKTKQIKKTDQYYHKTIFFIKYNSKKDIFILVPVKTKLHKSDSPAKQVLLKLLRGPTKGELKSGYRTLIPTGLILRNIYVKRKTIFLDFSNLFIKKQKFGREGLILQIYQIVNTMTRFRNINSVQFLINGKIISSSGGEGVVLNRKFYYNSSPLK